MRRLPALLLALTMTAAPAHAGTARKLTFQVPVTAPDETGAKVTIDTDVYLPAGKRPKGGWPFVEVFHGGGSAKDNTFDAGHAKYFAEHGYVSLIYSQRGNGNSTGLESVAGPSEMHDLFDVTHWALGQRFGIDRRRIALTGYSQGGMNTNLAQAWASDKKLNPYGIHFAVLEPGNTPDYIADALIPNGVDKLSVGVGLIETYLIGAKAHISPLLSKWIATESADAVYSTGPKDRCDVSDHDTATSPTLSDFAARSVGCFASRMTPPVLWAQGFDDGIFPSTMAIAMWRRMPHRLSNHLYLSMGGHAAPSARPEVEKDKLRIQLAYLDHYLKNRPLLVPAVVYWARDPDVEVPANAFAYPPKAWVRRIAGTWPPRGVRETRFGLGADGVLAQTKAAAGGVPLSGEHVDPGSDAVLQAGFSATPLGANPVAPGATGTSDPGVVAGFATPAFPAARELSGNSTLHVTWTPNARDTQLAVKVYDRAPDGTLTLLARAIDGIQGADIGVAKTLEFATNDYSVIVHKGHSVLVTISAGDASFYKAYLDSGPGGTLAAGPQSTITLPLTRPARAEPRAGAGRARRRDRPA
jgi:predicted acyl esterase